VVLEGRRPGAVHYSFNLLTNLSNATAPLPQLYVASIREFVCSLDGGFIIGTVEMLAMDDMSIWTKQVDSILHALEPLPLIPNNSW
jgi:hypothetical protein